MLRRARSVAEAIRFAFGEAGPDWFAAQTDTHRDAERHHKTYQEATQ